MLLFIAVTPALYFAINVIIMCIKMWYQIFVYLKKIKKLMLMRIILGCLS